jgi:hypothetical protein
MTILTSGYVGIGVSDPDAQLEVNNDSGSVYTAHFKNTGGTAPTLWVEATGNDANDTAVVKVDVNSATRFMISNQDGYVGIGTTAPQAALHVANNIAVGEGNELMFIDTSGNRSGSIYSDSSDIMHFRTGSGATERLSIQPGSGFGYGGALREVKMSGTTNTGASVDVDVTVPSASTGFFVTAHKTHQQAGWDSYFLGFIGSNTNSSNTYTRDISRNNSQAGTINASRTSATNVRVVLGSGSSAFPCTWHVLVSAY